MIKRDTQNNKVWNIQSKKIKYVDYKTHKYFGWKPVEFYWQIIQY